MNGSFFNTPTFPQAVNPTPTEVTPPGNVSVEQGFVFEQSLIENILRLNKGKRVRAYVSYPDSNEWRDKIYTGVIEQSGRDHLILADTPNKKWYLIRMIYLNYVEFDEPIAYNPDYSDTFD